jgi:hypothetical protein
MSPKTSPTSYKLPATSYLHGLLWLAFSGTAMISAFILPIHILALLAGYQMNLSGELFWMYFAFLFFCALYHALYRVKTILKDLGF